MTVYPDGEPFILAPRRGLTASWTFQIARAAGASSVPMNSRSLAITQAVKPQLSNQEGYAESPAVQ